MPAATARTPKETPYMPTAIPMPAASLSVRLDLLARVVLADPHSMPPR
jgi:hypothetical protein